MNDPSGTIELNYRTPCHIKLGRVSYDAALRKQEECIEKYRNSGVGLPVIFSLEHDPVITCGRSTDKSNLLHTEERYAELGIDLRDIDRGGDVTWHGPGQAVIYPIILLREHGLRASEWIKLLEESMIKVCAVYGVKAFRMEKMRGCFTEAGKIGAVGTAVKAGGITKHGIAFNVCPDLSYSKLIIPCGITSYPVTRLTDLTDIKVDIIEVRDELVRIIFKLLGLKFDDK